MPLHWRPLRRAFTSFLLVAVPIALLALFVWFTAHPDSPAVDRARAWPYVGWFVGRMQDRWRPPAPPPAPEASAGGSEVIVLGEPHRHGGRDYLWVAAGTPLREAPSAAAEIVATVEETINLFVDERRGEWARVHGRAFDGWVRSPAPEIVAGALGDRPQPVLPLPGRAPDPAELDRSLERFSSRPVVTRIGPYLAYRDGEGGAIDDLCAERIARSEERWTARYSVEPVGEAAEVILLFADRDAYTAFSEGLEGPLPPRTAHTGRGLVATWTSGRPAGEICRTLVHEIAHLLERRSLGPALPPWLGEGLAADFTSHLLEEAPQLVAVERAVERGVAPDFGAVVGLDSAGFYGSGRELHYASSAAWVRYLVSVPELAPRFRSFLAYLARGGPLGEDLGEEDFPEVRATPALEDDLLYFLERDETGLEAGFRSWLRALGSA